MKVLIFNGALERRENATPMVISNYLKEELDHHSTQVEVFHIAESGVPLFDTTIEKTPSGVEVMNHKFREADVHIWLTPLYHGGMTGVMKNCLDWLEYSSKLPNPYLTGKKVGLVCWADGVQAIQGINSMEAVAKALRAWVVPYSVAIHKPDLFDGDGNISVQYKERFKLLIELLQSGPNKVSALTEKSSI